MGFVWRDSAIPIVIAKAKYIIEKKEAEYPAHCDVLFGFILFLLHL